MAQSSTVAGPSLRRFLHLGAAFALLAAMAGAAPNTTTASAEEAAITAVIVDYAHAIEAKSLDQFRAVKPVLSPDEEQRLRTAFANTATHVVKFTVTSVEVGAARATVRLARRDTIGSIVASFPQKIVLAKGPKGWTIEEIGK